MEYLSTILLVVQVFVALSLIGFILIQHGKGADAGAAFGSGASGTVFGSQGSGNFLTKTTTILAVIFLANSLALGYLAANREAPASLVEDAELLQKAEQDSMLDNLSEIMENATEKAQQEDMTLPELDGSNADWDPAAPVPEDLPDMPADAKSAAEDLPAVPE